MPVSRFSTEETSNFKLVAGKFEFLLLLFLAFIFAVAPVLATPAITVSGVFTSAEGAGRTHMDVAGVWDGSSNIAPGRGDTFTVSFENRGSSSAGDFNPSVELPAGLSFATGMPTATLTFSGSSCPASAPSYSLNVSGQTATVNFGGGFDLPVKCTASVSVEAFADAGTTSGTLNVKGNAAYKNGSSDLQASSNIPVLVQAGSLLIDKLLGDGQSEAVMPGSTADFKIAVSNAGPGAIFGVSVTDTGTVELPFTAYAGPFPTNSAVDPSDSTKVNISYIPPEETYFLNAQSSVLSCTNLTNKASGLDLAGNTSSGDSSLKIDLETPLIEVTFADPFSLSFSGPTKVILNVSSAGMGAAEDLHIDFDLGSQAQFVRMLPGDWTYDNGTFSYTPGTLANGANTTIEFEIEAIQHCTAGGGSSWASLKSRYLDHCGNPYTIPGTVVGINGLSDTPNVSVAKTLSDRRIENGGSSSFVIAPTFTNPQNLDKIVTVTDVLPSNLASIDSIVAPTGTSYTCNGGSSCSPGDTLVWTIDLSATGGVTPTLTIPFTTHADVCTGGDYLENSASILATSKAAGTAQEVCTYEDTDGAYGIITNNIGGSATQRMNVDRSGTISGSFETGLADGTGSVDGTSEDGEGQFIPITSVYSFNSGMTSTWASVQYNDDFGRTDIEPHQSLVPNSLQVKVTDTGSGSDSGWVTLTNAQFTRDSDGLTIDFVNLFGSSFGSLSGISDKVGNYQLEIRYSTTIADAALGADGTREHNQVSTLTLDSGDSGACVGSDITYTTGVFIDTVRADAQLSASIPASIDVCKPFNMNLNVSETRANGIDIHDFASSVDLTGTPYQLDTDPTYGGELSSGTVYPSSTPNNGLQSFTNPNQWTGGNTGQITLPLIQLPGQGTTAVGLSANGTYKDNQGTAFNLSSTASPVLVNSAELVITVTPQTQSFTGNNATWNIFVTNTGAADSVNTTLTQTLSTDLILDEAATNAANSVAVQFSDPGTNKELFWDLGTIASGTSKEIELTVFAPVARMCDNINDVTDKVRANWGCGGVFEHAEHAHSPTFIFPDADLDVSHDTRKTQCPLCSDDSKVYFTLSNVGKRNLFNVWGKEDIGTDDGHGLTLPASADELYEYSLDGTNWAVFTPLAIDRTAGTFEIDSTVIPYLSELYRNSEADNVTTASKVHVRYNVIVTEPAATFVDGPAVTLEARADVACGASLDETQTDRIKILQAELVMDKLGANLTLAGTTDAMDAGLSYENTVYGVPGDLIAWRIQIQNTGEADGQYVRLEDVLPENGDHQTIQSIDSNCTLSGLPALPTAGTNLETFTLQDMVPNETCSVYVTATLGSTCINGTNEATASHACGNGSLTTPSILPDIDGTPGLDDNGSHNDTANLRMTPVFGAGNSVRQTMTDLPGGQKHVSVRVRNLGARATLNTFKNDLPANMVLASNVTYTDIAGSSSTLSISPGVSTFTVNLNGDISKNRDEFTVEFVVEPASHQDTASDHFTNPETEANSFDPAAPAAGDNVVTVNFTPGCGAAIENTDSVEIDLATPDLDIGVAPTTQLANQGGSNDFVFTISQNGDDNSVAGSINGTNEPITFVPTLGAGWTLNSISRTSGSGVTCNATSCTIDPMNKGDDVVITVNASVADTSQSLSLVGTVTGPYDATINYSLDTARARVVGVDFKKELIASNQDHPAHPSDDMLVGEQQTWRIAGKFYGLETGDATTAVSIKDTLPAGLGFVSYTDNAAGINVVSDTNPGTINSGDVSFTLSNASAPGGEFSIDLVTQVLNNADTPNGSIQTNTAELSFDLFGETFESADHSALKSTDSVDVLRPELQVVKNVRKVSGTYGESASGDAGDTFEYRLQVTNTGAAPLFSLNVVDTLADPTLSLN